MFPFRAMLESTRGRSRCYGVWILVICCGIQGCATTPYRYGHARAVHPIESSSADIEFEYGGPHPAMDRMRRVVEFPQRLLRGKKYQFAPELSPENRDQLASYLSQNDLADVRVLINQYDPGGEWQRLKLNPRVAPGWRYTAGVLSVTSYTLLPGRVFGYQHYNPYTNTLSVNSDKVASAVHEAACAKDIHGRSLPGTYATLTTVPCFRLWKTSRAVNDVLGYAQAEDAWELESGTYREYFSQVASGIVRPAQYFLTPMVNVVVTVGGGAVGHVVGRVVEQRRLAERQADNQNPEEESAIQTVDYSTTAE